MNPLLNSIQAGLIMVIIMWVDNFQFRLREVGWFLLSMVVLCIRDEANRQRAVTEWVKEYRSGGKIRDVADHA